MSVLDELPDMVRLPLKGSIGAAAIAAVFAAGYVVITGVYVLIFGSHHPTWYQWIGIGLTALLLLTAFGAMMESEE